MKIKEISFGYKRGLPGFSSVSTNVVAEVDENDNLDKVWDKLKQECKRNSDLDASWIGGENE